MNLTLTQPEAALLAERLQQRLVTLGVTVLRVAPEGTAAAAGAARPIEQLLAGSAMFAAAVRGVWRELSEPGSPLVTLWPGLWLVPLGRPRRRRSPAAAGRPAPALLTGLLLGPDLLLCEQLPEVCGQQQVDLQATIAQIDPATLVQPAEAQRLAQTLAWMHEDVLEQERRSGELHTLSQQLSESYEELSLLYKLSTSMTVDQPPALFLTEACRELQQVLGLRWMALQLVDHEPRLNELAGQVFHAGPLACDPELVKRIGRTLMVHLQLGAGPTVVDDTQDLRIPFLPRIARNLLVVPLAQDDKPLGILFGGDKLDGSHISSIDSKLCSSLASSLTMFLENAMLFEDMQAMFLGALRALVSAIDAKDSYTHGHSERVAMLTRQLAQAAGLDARMVERVHLAALVHDLGKIGIPETVLCKPERLTTEEFAIIKSHPEIGARILQDIHQMHDLMPGVLHHHEMWNGKGYPQGLNGEGIPLFGRLICIADSFDAMCSNRTYRRSLTIEHALDEIRRCAGTQFDPKLAEVFTTLDFGTFSQMIHEHQEKPSGPVRALGAVTRWAEAPRAAAALRPPG